MQLSLIRWDMILGGFGLFMFGIEFMGDGLKSAAGDKLRDYIDKYTSNPLQALLIGILITIVMQSSSATTAITIGLVRAGLMNLEQAAGIVMGANIGTTVTSFLISLNFDKFSLYIVFIGAMICCFAKKRKFKNYGNVILGFGLLFYGLNFMGEGLSALKDLPEFETFAASMASNPLLGLCTGTLLTALVQASAATIGVVQKMYQAGAIPFNAVLPFIFGANIGTTITGILAAIGGSLAARRTAGIHTLFNIVGASLGMLLLVPYSALVTWLGAKMNLAPMMQIAVTHILFNTITTIVFFPLLKQMCKIVRKIIPGEEPERMEVDIDDLDSSLASQLPSTGIAASSKAILKMADVVRQDIQECKTFLNKPGNAEDRDMLSQTEALINSFDKKITDFLVKISNNATLSKQDSEDIRLNLEVIKNLERIGDLSMNVVEFFSMVFEDDGSFTENANEDINMMFDMMLHMFNRSIEIYKTRNDSLYASLMDEEDTLDKYEYDSRQKHFERMAKSQCGSAVAASIYCDVLANLERMGDHCCNIAKSSVTATVDDISPDEKILTH
ncbi:MAG: Na/Pi cotransporter family protein [Erysipelotrichia bacterium]|nr:Na/Pi cotransporter family protein [Erysipelotrichia bacterium]